ncbi:MAG: RDD family protein [Dehalococcoidia bacterium]
MDNTRYQTFWQRFVASLIDAMVLGPVGYPTTLLIGYGPLSVAIAWIIVTCPAGFLYTSYCHGRWGKTLGKYAAGIEVVRHEDNAPLGFGRAIRRDLGAIVLALAGAAVLVTYLATGGETESFRAFDQSRFQITEERLENESAGELFRRTFEDSLPPWQTMVIPALSSLWFFAELTTMFSNPKRRALHDLIGGSVVIKSPPKLASASPPV